MWMNVLDACNPSSSSMFFFFVLMRSSLSWSGQPEVAGSLFPLLLFPPFLLSIVPFCFFTFHHRCHSLVFLYLDNQSLETATGENREVDVRLSFLAIVTGGLRDLTFFCSIVDSLSRKKTRFSSAPLSVRISSLLLLLLLLHFYLFPYMKVFSSLLFFFRWRQGWVFLLFLLFLFSSLPSMQGRFRHLHVFLNIIQLSIRRVYTLQSRRLDRWESSSLGSPFSSSSSFYPKRCQGRSHMHASTSL